MPALSGMESTTLRYGLGKGARGYRQKGHFGVIFWVYSISLDEALFFIFVPPEKSCTRENLTVYQMYGSREETDAESSSLTPLCFSL